MSVRSRGGMFGAGLRSAIMAVLQGAAGDATPIERVVPVGGGDISAAARLTTAKSDYFVKWNDRPLPGMFPAEAQGLAALECAAEVRVPHVFGLAEVAQDRPAFILMEWLAGSGDRTRQWHAELGRGLALLHKHTQQIYGWRQDNTIGSLPQINPASRDWLQFYRDSRLGYQMELATRKGRMPQSRRQRLERLLERLDDWIDESHVQPSLLHGDLWSGNTMVGPVGEPVLIDPAVYYGDREVELAFTELFGGFAPAFYDAYNEGWPLSPEYSERRPLYQLYPLLVHLNLFGEGYGGSVDRILARYVG